MICSGGMGKGAPPSAARANASKVARTMSSFSASQVSSGPLTGWNLQAPNCRVRRSSEDAPVTWVTPSIRCQPLEPNTWKLKPAPVVVMVPR